MSNLHTTVELLSSDMT